MKESELIHENLRRRMVEAGFVERKDVCRNCKYYEIWVDGCGYSDSQRCTYPDFMDKSEQTVADYGYNIAPYTTNTGWCPKYERDKDYE